MYQSTAVLVAEGQHLLCYNEDSGLAHLAPVGEASQGVIRRQVISLQVCPLCLHFLQNLLYCLPLGHLFQDCFQLPSTCQQPSTFQPQLDFLRALLRLMAVMAARQCSLDLSLTATCMTTVYIGRNVVHIASTDNHRILPRDFPYLPAGAQECLPMHNHCLCKSLHIWH